MDRLPVEWLAAPDDDEKPPENGISMTFVLTGDWFAVDADQLILPVEIHEKTTISVEEPYDAILKQYGGESLLNDMLLADEQELAEGTAWRLDRYEERGLLTISPSPEP